MHACSSHVPVGLIVCAGAVNIPVTEYICSMRFRDVTMPRDYGSMRKGMGDDRGGLIAGWVLIKAAGSSDLPLFR